MKIFNSIFALLFIAVSAQSFAQGTDGFNYQAVVRNGSGSIIANQNVSYRFNILQGSVSGTEVYSEDHSVSTDDRGLVNMVIGTGSTSGNFSSINWGASSYYLEVELDENGGNSYTPLGTTEFNSVPYAFHALTAGNVDDADSNPSNELQNLSLSGNSLSISSGNTVTLPSGSGNSDASAKAWARVTILGTANIGTDTYGVTSVSKPSTGVYVVQLTPGLFATATNPAASATVLNDLDPGVAICTYSSSPSQITIRTYNLDSNLTDKSFSLLVFGKD